MGCDHGGHEEQRMTNVENCLILATTVGTAGRSRSKPYPRDCNYAPALHIPLRRPPSADDQALDC